MMVLKLSAALVCAAAVAACSGSGGTANGVAVPAATPAATASPTPGPTATPTVAPTPTPVGTATPIPTATPAPTATPTATASPSGSGIQLTPSTVNPIPAQGGCVAHDAGFTASETGYAGMFSAVSNDTTKATVSPSSSSGAFTVHAVANGTSTTITVTDTLGHTATENVVIQNNVCLP